MNPEQQSHFISKRLEDHRRAAHRSLHCYICTAPAQFRGEQGFLEHLKKAHPEVAEDAPDGPVFRAAIQQAAAKAKQRDPPKADRLPLSRPSSGDSLKLNYGDAQSISASSRPMSLSVLKDPGPRIDEFRKLTLNQGSVPGVIPMKRAAGIQQSSDPKTRADARNAPKAQRTQRRSYGDNADFERGKTHSTKKLYDPNTDRPSFGKLSSAQISQSQDARGQRSKPIHQIPPETGNSHQHGTRPRTADTNPHSGELQPFPVHIHESTVKDGWEEEEPELLLQPETRPVLNEQLEREAETIYSGLELLESQCMKVDERQLKIAQDRDPTKRIRLSSNQWSALISLHKALLHEHYDFFLASQHPSAGTMLLAMAGKYDMPNRLWEHGIRALLEVLKYNLPDSEEFMLYFLNISYSMVALLYETTPIFADTWMECLGDLGGYRMIVNDNEQYDREIWAGVAKLWYMRALDRHPGTGRLLHHLGCLARPYSIQKLSLYCRALSAVHPWNETRQEMIAMFKPFLADLLMPAIKQNSLDTYMIKCLAILFTGRSTKEYSKYCQNIINHGSLNKYCERANTKFKETGVAICICTLSGLLEFGASRPDGSSRSIIRRALHDMGPLSEAGTSINLGKLEPTQTQNTGLTDEEYNLSANSIRHACKIAFEAFAVGLERYQDRNVIPMVHAYAAFLKTVAPNEQIMRHIEMDIPWNLFVGYLNHYTNPGTMTKTCLSADFPKPAEDVIGRPLPEDFIMREQMLFCDYFPATWFTDADVDDEEKLLELPSMASPRLSRILWSGIRIASHQKWIHYNHETFRFSETAYAISLKPRQLPYRFEAGVLEPQLERLISSTWADLETIDVPLARVKPDKMSLDTPESTNAPRPVLTQIPKILKRQNRTETTPDSAKPSLP